MFVKPMYVMLLSGNEERFDLEIAAYHRFFTKEVGMPSGRINYVKCRPEFTTGEIKHFFESLPRFRSSDVLVVYSGHGIPGFFKPNGSLMPYENLAELLDRNGNFIFINGCCHSGSAIPIFESAGILPEKGLVIVSSRQSDEGSYTGDFRISLLKSLKNGKRYSDRVLGTQQETGLIQFNASAPLAIRKEVEGEITEVVPRDGRWNFSDEGITLVFKHHPVRSGKDLEHLLFPFKVNQWTESA